MIMKHILKILTTFIFIVFCLTGCTRGDPIELDPFKNMEIEYTGWNGSGKAKVENTIDYTGNNESIKKFIDSISYKITPNKDLTNGDTITVELKYTKDAYKLANVTLKKEKKEFRVQGLLNGEHEVVTKKEMFEQNGEEKEKFSQSYVYDGVEIPAEWNLTEEEKQKYIAYIQGNSQNNSLEDPGAEQQWFQGESETVTHRDDADFLVKDYLDNAISCYQDAYNYGATSSQRFKIDPIVENDKMVGYRCVFAED